MHLYEEVLSSMICNRKKKVREHIGNDLNVQQEMG